MSDPSILLYTVGNSSSPSGRGLFGHLTSILDFSSPSSAIATQLAVDHRMVAWQSGHLGREHLQLHDDRRFILHMYHGTVL